MCEYISAAGGSPGYYSECGLAAGPALPLLDQCVTGLPQDPCDQFHGENCQYASQESQHNHSHIIHASMKDNFILTNMIKMMLYSGV